MKKLCSLFFYLSIPVCILANISLPKIFGDNMVLQRDKPIKVWGWASAKEKLTIQLDQQTKTTQADKTGKWQVTLAPEKAGGPFQLTIKGKNQLTLNNILIGEVWICSGQSNMEMPVAGWGKINNYQQEINNADYPQIRHFKVANAVSMKLKDDIAGGEWKICSSTTAGEFSATAYFFARELYNRLKVPVGLINSSWGGTQSEAWTSQQAFEQSDEFKDIATLMKQDGTEVVNKRYENRIKSIEKIAGTINAEDVANWKNEDYDDSKWLHLQVPGVWESQGLAGLDGVVWFRKTITVSSEDAGKEAVIELSKIDDRDKTYINGIKIGETNVHSDQRKYTIPAGLLKTGKNIIAVRVEDTGGDGGIYGDKADVKLTIGGNILPLAGEWNYKIESVLKPSSALGPNDYPSLLFNAMINPLIPLTVQGVIWYQGETNAGRAYQYRKAFPLMITDWRKHWNEPDLPFYFVQLAGFGSADANSNKGSTWAELREAQTKTLSLPNTGMAVITDIGNPFDIHPKNKQEVGRRLALIALHDVYKNEGEYTGPVYQSMEINNNKIILSFTHAGNSWQVKDKYGYIKGFEIAGSDQKFRWAKAEIQGDKIIVYQDSLTNPVAVRYAWADDTSEANLFNEQLLPVAPFRTDNWKGITDNNKYTVQQ